MKKRILGLLLALCLVIGLLPMAAMAEANPATFVFSWATGYGPLGKKTVNAGSTTYIKMNDAKKPVTGSASDWCIKLEYPTEGPAVLTLKDVDMSGEVGLILGTYVSAKQPTPDQVTCEVPINVVLEGTNTINVTHQNLGALDLHTKGDVTFSGTGSLKVRGNKAELNNGAIISSFGNMTFNNVDVSVELREAYYRSHAIAAIGGNITVKGGKVNVLAYDDPAVKDGGSSLETINAAMYANNITIQDGAKVSMLVSPYNSAVLKADSITIKDSDVEMALIGYYSSAKLFSVAPTLTYAGEYTAKCSIKSNTYDATAGFTAAGQQSDFTAETALGSLTYFKVAHKCVAGADDKDCTTGSTCGACGAEISAGQAQHNIPTDDGDCTTAVKCQNAGCDYVATEAKSAHTAASAQTDCKVAVKCSNPGCTKDAIAAKDHTPEARTDCSKAANCTVCGKEAIAAGQHGGGTATCKAKAKCATCGQEYGELGACAPAADDGDCTTAIKCSVCDKETTAAKAAHAYTNDADTTCDNAGCTKTREVSGTNGSPATGDVSILLTAALALSSAASVAGITLIRKKEN